MESTVSQIPEAGAAELVGAIFDEVEALGRRLEDALPGLTSIWLVGSAAQRGGGGSESFELATTGSAWVCSSELSFVVVSEEAIPGPTLRCLQTGIGIRIGGLRVRLRHFRSPWLAQQMPGRREGYELALSRKLIAGDGTAIEAIDTSFVTRASASAAENLCVDTLELLLRCHPRAPMLERVIAPENTGGDTSLHAELVLRGGLTESARNLGDARLLLAGRFAVDRKDRLKALLTLLDEDSSSARVAAWAYSAQPLLEELPLSAEDLWIELRNQTLDILCRAVESRLGRTLDSEVEILNHVRNCRRSTWSRIKRFFAGKQRAGGREYAQLLMMLTLLSDETQEGARDMMRAAIHLLSLVGGPILANPDWGKLRREALLVEPWQHLLPSPLMLRSREAATIPSEAGLQTG